MQVSLQSIFKQTRRAINALMTIGSQKIMHFFYPTRHTLIIFSLFSLVGIGFILLYGYGDVYDLGWLLLLQIVVYTMLPIWFAIASIASDNTYFPIAALLAFAYLYLLSCLISYAIRWVRRVGSITEPKTT